MKRFGVFLLVSVFAAVLLFPDRVGAAGGELINLQVGEKGDLASSVKVFVLMTLVAFLPSLFVMTTTFVKFQIVLALMRNALGTTTTPPNIVINGLALYLTLFVMFPVFQTVYDKAYSPYDQGKMEFKEAVLAAEKPVKKFLLDNSEEEHIKQTLKMAKMDVPKNYEGVPFTVAVVAHSISQIEDALGFSAIILIVFAIIDMIVATVLMLLGMFMLPPPMISLPIKILTFLAAGGFSLIVESLVASIKI